MTWTRSSACSMGTFLVGAKAGEFDAEPSRWWSPSWGVLTEHTIGACTFYSHTRAAFEALRKLPTDAVRLAPDAGQAREPENGAIEAGADPIVAAVDLLFEHRHTLPADVLRSMADIWVCASAAKYGEPYERFWEDDPFAGHDTDECEAENATTPPLDTDTTPAPS